MKPLQGLTWLLILQLCGEILTRLLNLPFPGPVIGMVLLWPALGVPAIRGPVTEAARFLLAHLSLLFVPVGVGVITHLDVLGQYGLKLMLVIALSTWLGLAVTALVLRGLLRGRVPPAPEEARDA